MALGGPSFSLGAGAGGGPTTGAVRPTLSGPTQQKVVDPTQKSLDYLSGIMRGQDPLSQMLFKQSREEQAAQQAATVGQQQQIAAQAGMSAGRQLVAGQMLQREQAGERVDLRTGMAEQLGKRADTAAVQVAEIAQTQEKIGLEREALAIQKDVAASTISVNEATAAQIQASLEANDTAEAWDGYNELYDNTDWNNPEEVARLQEVYTSITGLPAPSYQNMIDSYNATQITNATTALTSNAGLVDRDVSFIQDASGNMTLNWESLDSTIQDNITSLYNAEHPGQTFDPTNPEHLQYAYRRLNYLTQTPDMIARESLESTLIESGTYTPEQIDAIMTDYDEYVVMETLGGGVGFIEGPDGTPIAVIYDQETGEAIIPDTAYANSGYSSTLGSVFAVSPNRDHLVTGDGRHFAYNKNTDTLLMLKDGGDVNTPDDYIEFTGNNAQQIKDLFGGSTAGGVEDTPTTTTETTPTTPGEAPLEVTTPEDVERGEVFLDEETSGVYLSEGGNSILFDPFDPSPETFGRMQNVLMMNIPDDATREKVYEDMAQSVVDNKYNTDQLADDMINNWNNGGEEFFNILRNTMKENGVGGDWDIGAGKLVISKDEITGVSGTAGFGDFVISDKMKYPINVGTSSTTNGRQYTKLNTYIDTASGPKGVTINCLVNSSGNLTVSFVNPETDKLMQKTFSGIGGDLGKVFDELNNIKTDLGY